MFFPNILHHKRAQITMNACSAVCYYWKQGKKIVAEAWYKRRTVAYHHSSEVINSSPKSHCLWREGLTWGDRPKNPNSLWVWGRDAESSWENWMISVWEWYLWCFLMSWDVAWEVLWLYSHVWWLTDEMVEKDEKFKKNRSACNHSHRWAQQANTAPKIGKKFPIISLELQTIVLNLYNWKRLLSFQFCIAVIFCVCLFCGNLILQSVLCFHC